MVDVTVNQVQSIYGQKEPALSPVKRQKLVDVAERFVEDILDGRVSRIGIIEGNEEDLARWVAAHMWELAEGGEATGQSQTGGNVNYQHLTMNDPRSALRETRYGRMALLYLRQDASIGIVRSDI